MAKIHQNGDTPTLNTRVLPVNASNIGKICSKSKEEIETSFIEDWDLDTSISNPDITLLKQAADELRHSNVPVAFPTETVYGLGADATRSEAVRGIYKAKQRPSDNPLIVHFSSLKQLRDLLRPSASPHPSSHQAPSQQSQTGSDSDPIPAIYHPLIKQFWPGPLTLILPLPSPSPLAPEVTASLRTFGARIPAHPLALALIHLTGRPIAAPSANASTLPSPTCAEHVFSDLQGRISTILDGGPCDVGVESTVVDGLSVPPVVLRPGGVSLGELRKCDGWEDVRVGYEDRSLKGEAEGPRAPGMKYRHYSPRARVVLYEAGKKLRKEGLESVGKVGIIRTKRWKIPDGFDLENQAVDADQKSRNGEPSQNGTDASKERLNPLARILAPPIPSPRRLIPSSSESTLTSSEIWDVPLTASTKAIARGLFSALRDLDRLGVDVIYVEGIDDGKGRREGDEGERNDEAHDGGTRDSNEEKDLAAAIMNRLRKAAEVEFAVTE
ncbi:translation factor [Aulographum hederae CBS 113979]|uniref:Threonylcarbamoyl-AMP synthase n=1 Tax=Aulographum hederae CBS 113979 TaxID=1176131 RepID=A0A6G1GXR8_9PEZI|nr:translation factor [Aulographum hederae CBS 113979]